MDDQIVIPVNTSFVVVAAFVGIAIGLLIAFLLAPQVAAKAVGDFSIVRDERGHIMEVKGFS